MLINIYLGTRGWKWTGDELQASEDFLKWTGDELQASEDFLITSNIFLGKSNFLNI